MSIKLAHARTWAIRAGAVAVLVVAMLAMSGFFAGDPIRHLLGGGLLIGAFFMATDMVTSPVTNKGAIETREELRSTLPERARAFTWERTAEGVEGVWQGLVR